MGFRELSDEEWGVISSFLPPKPRRGRRALSDDRSLINGILYVVTTGFRWREMPRKYGIVTAGEGLEDFRRLGVWDRIIEFLTSMSCKRVAIDSTTVEAKRGVRR